MSQTFQDKKRMNVFYKPFRTIVYSCCLCLSPFSGFATPSLEGPHYCKTGHSALILWQYVGWVQFVSQQPRPPVVWSDLQICETDTLRGWSCFWHNKKCTSCASWPRLEPAAEVRCLLETSLYLTCWWQVSQSSRANILSPGPPIQPHSVQNAPLSSRELSPNKYTIA